MEESADYLWAVIDKEPRETTHANFRSTPIICIAYLLVKQLVCWMKKKERW